MENRFDILPANTVLPERLMIIPLSSRPIFPGLSLPLTFTGKNYIKVIEQAFETDHRVIGAILAKEINKDDFSKSKFYKVGTALKIYRLQKITPDTVQILVQALERFSKTGRTIKRKPLTWKVKYYPNKSDQEISKMMKAYSLSIISALKELLSGNSLFQEQIKLLMSNLTYQNPALLIDLTATILSASAEKLQDLLETIDLRERAEKLLLLLKEEIQISRLQEKIEKQIEEKISKQQKEFFLREQLKIIKKELGLEKDDKTAEIEKFQERIKKIKLSEEAKEVVSKELEKLKMLEMGSAEYNVTRNYLNTILELPWGVYSKDNLNIHKVRKILNEDHYGLEDVKDTILEYISTIIKRGSVIGSILCLVGPPGVGKTSVGRSIARAMNRKFFRFSLGGMRDEAEIKGHRRTYVGAMPGKMIQSLRRTKTANPVIMLDEIDKVGKSFMGDPASALLEVLDPEQNKEFLDHYLDIHFDLSKILFITTANQLDTIPKPLLDRMEVIRLSGYIKEEKIQIAKKYLIPKQLKEHGLTKSEINISDRVLDKIVEDYAREAGVRNLENNIKKILRKITLEMAEGKKNKFSVTLKNLSKYLGNPVFYTEKLYKKPMIGVSLGLAWTAYGGATLYIEALAIKSKSGGLKQTGQLGDVMQESVQIAYSYVKSILAKSGNNFFEENFIHLHVPAGATPKDGPSAGITIATALYSLGMGIPVRTGIAMTGELTLTGKVLPIGGVKEKTIAARRVKIGELIFPKENETDFNQLPDYLKKGITVHFVDYFDDVIKIIFYKKAGKK